MKKLIFALILWPLVTLADPPQGRHPGGGGPGGGFGGPGGGFGPGGGWGGGPGGGFGGAGQEQRRQRAIMAARSLSRSLQQLSREAQRAMLGSIFNGGELHALRAIAFDARELAREVEIGVSRPLMQGAPLRRVENAVDQLAWGLRNLNENIRCLQRVPRSLQEASRDVAVSYRMLRASL